MVADTEDIEYPHVGQVLANVGCRHLIREACY
jgi:hypothetical protein